MSAEFDNLVSSVRNLHTVADSCVTLLSTLSDLIEDTAGDRTAALALAAEVDAKKDLLAQAVVDNTPVPPTPPPA